MQLWREDTTETWSPLYHTCRPQNHLYSSAIAPRRVLFNTFFFFFFITARIPGLNRAGCVEPWRRTFLWFPQSHSNTRFLGASWLMLLFYDLAGFGDRNCIPCKPLRQSAVLCFTFSVVYITTHNEYSKVQLK